MTAQPDLFDPGQRHSSKAKRKLDRQKVLLWYAGYLLGTSDEAAEGLGMDRLCTRPRTTELVDEGLLVKRPDLPRKSTGKGGTSGVLEITLRGEREARALLAHGEAA